MIVESFQNKGHEEQGKIFVAAKRCPADTGVSAEIFPGDKFEIFCYFDEGIYMLENQTRPAQNCYVWGRDMYELIDSDKPVEVDPEPVVLPVILYTLFFNSYGTLKHIYNGPDETIARKIDGVLDNDDQHTFDHHSGWFELITWENGKSIREETRSIMSEEWSNE